MISARAHGSDPAMPADPASDLVLAVIDMVVWAEEQFAAGRSSEAREQLERLRGITDSATQLHVRVLTDLAVIAARAGNHVDAEEMAREAIAHRPGHAPALEVLDHCKAPTTTEPATDLQAERIERFTRLSTCQRVEGTPVRRQPVLLLGAGRISFGESVSFGWPSSPGFYDQSAYVEASHEDTHIQVGDETLFNNGVTLRAEGPGISIGRDCLFGWSVTVLDSDFHDLHPNRRRTGTPATGHVSIGNNVFLGAHTHVLKGVTIGDDTVVGASSVVLDSLPAGVIAGGNPARVIRALESEE
jgi:acetyltransferase-like isoleucine patch superfamily enzyme